MRARPLGDSISNHRDPSKAQTTNQISSHRTPPAKRAPARPAGRPRANTASKAPASPAHKAPISTPGRAPANSARRARIRTEPDRINIARKIRTRPEPDKISTAGKTLASIPRRVSIRAKATPSILSNGPVAPMASLHKEADLQSLVVLAHCGAGDRGNCGRRRRDKNGQQT